MSDNIVQFRGRSRKPGRMPSRFGRRQAALVGLLLGMAGLGLAAFQTAAFNGGDITVSETFRRCGAVRETCVVDGDTLHVSGVVVRVADIDTPEISEPKCAAERQRGEQATERFIALLNEGPFVMRTRGKRLEDKYGRKLYVLERNGRSLGEQLVQEGLAHRWIGHKQSWCG